MTYKSCFGEHSNDSPVFDIVMVWSKTYDVYNGNCSPPYNGTTYCIC